MIRNVIETEFKYYSTQTFFLFKIVADTYVKNL